MTVTRSTCVKGIAKSRRGSPAIGLQTLIDKAIGKDRPGSIVKKAEVTRAEAREAKKQITKKQSPLRYLDAGAISGVASPLLIQPVGRATQALFNAKKGRWGAARRALTDTTKGEVAKNVVQGTLLGAGISAAREGAATARAKDTYDEFLRQTSGKDKKAGAVRLISRLHAQGLMPRELKPYEDEIEREAMGYVNEAGEVVGIAPRKDGKSKTAVAAPAGPSIPKPPTPKSSLSDKAADSAARTGRFKGVATQNSLKPPGPSVSQIAVNPRRNVTQAINAFRS